MDKSIENLKVYTRKVERVFCTRTVLYNLKPEGIGTPYIESLTSYIARLAAVHSVSTAILLKKILEPKLSINHIKDELIKGNNKSTGLYINKNNSITLDFVQALESLTGRRDIQNLTMLNWQGVLTRNIVGDYRKWCPACFNQMIADSKVIYEPLIWYLNDIEKCDIHQISLKDECDKCKKKLPFIHSQIIVGYCQYCGSWLGEEVNIPKDPLNEMENFIVLNYKQLIENTPKLKYFPSKIFISLYLKKIIREAGFTSVRSLARYLDFNFNTIYNYLYGKNIPDRYYLLKMVSKLNNTIFELVYDENIIIDVDVNKFNKDNYSRKKTTPLNIIECRLNENLNLEYPKHLTKVSNDSGFGVDTAKKHFPVLCAKLEEKLLALQKKCEMETEVRILGILNDCLNEDIPISLTKLAKQNGIPIRKIRKYSPDFSKKVSQRYTTYLSTIKKRRIESTLEEIKKIANDLHQRGIYPSNRKIIQSLENKNIFMYKEIMDGWREIVIQLGYKPKK